MALQLLTKNASAFSIDSGADLEISSSKLTCSDYTVHEDILWGVWIAHHLKSNGDILAISITYKSRIYTIPSGFGTPSYVTLSDNDINNKYGITVDSNGNIYISICTNPGHIKKYNSSGTLQWTYSGAGSTPGVLTLPADVFCYNDRIFLVATYNHYVIEIDTSGNFVQEININAYESRQRPRALWVDSAAVWTVANYGYLVKLNLSTLAFIETTGWFSNEHMMGNHTRIRRLSDGTWLIGTGLDGALYSQTAYQLCDSACNVIDEITFPTDDFANDSVKGGVRRPMQGYSCPMVDETNKVLFATSYVPNYTDVIEIDMRDPGGRYATVQHVFDAEVTLKRIFPMAEVDNRKTYKQFNIDYQRDGGGYVNLDIDANADLDQDVTILDIRVEINDWRFINRDRPTMTAIGVIYNDNISAATQKINVDQEVL